MKKSFILVLYLASCILYTSTNVFAVDVAPRISDREIIEKLARLEEGQNTIRAEMKVEINGVKAEMQVEINGVKAEMKAGQNALQQQITDLKESTNKRFDDMNSRFDDLRWMLSIFITIALVILGFVLRMQWQMHRRQTQTETTLETQKDELAFLKTLIEKLLPPKGVL